ncbi:MAG TPA: hypothetical protein PK566_13875 [Pseudobacteroides sp.]|nr:hypothetical protein [Pseudobacteroides sp.]
MRNKRSNRLVKALSVVVCSSILFMASTSLVFAAGKDAPKPPVKDDKPGQTAKKVQIDDIQKFLLDAISSKNNKEIANYIAAVNTKNLVDTTNKIAKALKGTWNTKDGQAAVKNVLIRYLLFTQKAKLGFTTIISEGINDVVVPADLYPKVKEKLNTDITGDKKDDRGVKFVIKSIKIVQSLVSSLNDETIVTLKLNNLLIPKFELNSLEKYPFVTSSITDIFQTMNTLPFDNDFASFAEYYTNYLNSLNIYEAISFVYLLQYNNIPYEIGLQ